MTASLLLRPAVPSPPMPPDIIKFPGISAEAMRAIQVTVYGSAVIASAVSPTGANKPGSVARLAGVARCTGPVLEHAQEDVEPPDEMTAMPNVLGSSYMQPPGAAQTGGMMLSTSVTVAALTVFAMVVGAKVRRNAPTEVPVYVMKYLKPTSIAGLSLGLSYFGPTLMQGSAALLSHERTQGNEYAIVLSMIAIAVVGIVGGVTWYGCLERSASDDSRWRGFSNVLDDLHTAAREPSVWYMRHLFFEDLIVALALGALDGYSSATRQECSVVGGLQMLVAVLHLIYLVKVRPHEERSELIVALLNAVLLLVIASISLYVHLTDSIDGVGGATLGWALLVADLSFFLETIGMCVLALRKKCASNPTLTDGVTKPRAVHDATAPLLVQPVHGSCTDGSTLVTNLPRCTSSSGAAATSKRPTPAARGADSGNGAGIQNDRNEQASAPTRIANPLQTPH